MTLQDFKDQAAQNREYKDFEHLLNHCFSIQDPSLAFEVMTEAAELYASQQFDEGYSCGANNSTH